jgi:hypothetical protein
LEKITFSSPVTGVFGSLPLGSLLVKLALEEVLEVILGAPMVFGDGGTEKKKNRDEQLANLDTEVVARNHHEPGDCRAKARK